jgi:DNA-binding MarR family transcriptional regulator
MDSDQKFARNKRGQYNKISIEDRKALLILVCNENLSIRQAAMRLNMKYSTAKSIIHLYKTHGRIERVQDLIPLYIKPGEFMNKDMYSLSHPI